MNTNINSLTNEIMLKCIFLNKIQCIMLRITDVKTRRCYAWLATEHVYWQTSTYIHRARATWGPAPPPGEFITPCFSWK